jgi:hypothetical protein
MNRGIMLTGATLLLVTVVAGCGILGRSSGGTDRLVEPGTPRTAPSGRFVASVVDGPEQNGVPTQVVVISDDKGTEVFRDDYAYSTRHGVGVVWLSGRDQLWLLSSDVGTAYVEQGDSGWVKTAITPETRDQIPAEIAELR